MTSSILIIIFSIAAALESAAYGFYEWQVNKNKVGGTFVIILSILRTFLSNCCIFIKLAIAFYFHYRYWLFPP